MFRPWVSVRKLLLKKQFRRINLWDANFSNKSLLDLKVLWFHFFKFPSLKSCNCIKANCKKWMSFRIGKSNYSPQPPHEGTNLDWCCFAFISKYRGITVHLSMPCAANLGTGIKLARLRQVFKFKLVTANELKPSQLKNAEMK